MKLVLQVAAGIVLAACVIAGGIYSYNRFIHRSTATKYELAAARSTIDTLVRTCPALSSSEKCTQLAMNDCEAFHINQDDCAELVRAAVEKVKAEQK